MIGLVGLLVLFIVVGPITLSIVALVKISALNNEIHQLRNYVHDRRTHKKESAPTQAAPAAGRNSRPAEPVTPVAPKESTKESKRVVPPALPTQRAPEIEFDPILAPKQTVNLEFLMGGKAAAFAGIGILVVGIVFLVVYAVQHSFIGPGTRIVLGLLAGGGLVGIGHVTERKDAKYKLLARVLTGGGSALFYFAVFAAYGIYHLISAVTAGFGLFASALAIFGLAMVYQSQAVAVLGVLGAFVAPLLIGDDMDAGIFSLVYVALVNVPVILLGVRRKWQVLYNLAFVCTVIHYLIWLDGVGTGEWWIGWSFAILFFAEFAALGLLKLRCEQNITGRAADSIRLISSSLLLLGATYWLLYDAGMDQWMGSAFIALALLHLALAWFAFKVLSQFNNEILAFLAGGLIFAALALPAQLDGEWVSLGWAIEGVVLAWFASRVSSRTLQLGAFVLGLIGIMKALLYDVSLYPHTPNLFLNARFVVGLLSAALLGVQGKIAGRFPSEGSSSHWQDLLWWCSALAVVLIFFADTFWTLGADEAFSWLITSLMLLATGVALLLFAPPKSSVTILGSIMVLVVPIKLLVIDTWMGLELGLYHLTPFSNAVIWVQLIVVGVIILGCRPLLFKRNTALLLPTPTYASLLNILSLAAGIGIISIEILHKQSDWADTAVTIFWAISALALILFGMKRKTPSHRYFGLFLFCLTTLKVLFVDSSELQGLERIAAFIGTGILLLVLSFAYQKASAYFLSQGTKS